MRRALAWLIALATLCGSAPTARAAGLTTLLRRETSLLSTLEGLVGKAVRAEAELTRLARRQRLLDYELKEATRRAEALESRLRERQKHVRARVVGLYKLSRGRYLRLLVESKSRRELLLRAAALRQVLRRDLGELALYRDELAKLSKEKTRLAKARAAQKAARLALLERKNELSKARRGRKLLLRRLARSRRLRQQVSGELSKVQRLLLTRINRLRKRVRHAGGFAARKGRLPRPVGGAIVGNFGRARDRASGLSVLRSGITFRPYRGVRVRAVHSGVVRLAQPLSGYGKLVLVDHGEGYFTVYGFLAQISVKVGQRVRLGSVVGKSGEDPLTGRSAAYFEIRDQKTPVDPRTWLRR
jgi:septal ring factor EnvC (AmiA/AmiB activator)